MRIWKLCFLLPVLFLAGCDDNDKAMPEREQSNAVPSIFRHLSSANDLRTVVIELAGLQR
jgi:hypothetical protein